MESTFDIIDRICKEKRVEPREILGYLLQILEERHRLAVLGDSSKYSGPKHNVIGEIKGIISQSQQPDDVPSSLLKLIEIMLPPQHFFDSHNAKVYKDAGRGLEGDQFQRRAEAAAALCVIIREIINQAEQCGIEGSIRFDDFAKKQGIKFERPDEPPASNPEPT